MTIDKMLIRRSTPIHGLIKVFYARLRDGTASTVSSTLPAPPGSLAPVPATAA